MRNLIDGDRILIEMYLKTNKCLMFLVPLNIDILHIAIDERHFHEVFDEKNCFEKGWKRSLAKYVDQWISLSRQF